MDPNVKSSIEQRLIESGEKERLKVIEQVKKRPIDMDNTKAVIFGPTEEYGVRRGFGYGDDAINLKMIYPTENCSNVNNPSVRPLFCVVSWLDNKSVVVIDFSVSVQI